MSDLIAKGDDQVQSWDDIWENKSILNRIVDVGRVPYNWWFLHKIGKHAKVDAFCELGCGTSSLLAKIAKTCKKVVGIDNSDKALERSRRFFKTQGVTNGEFIKDDALDLKIEERFDTVWSQGLIEHFEDPAKVVQQHLKITKKGGTTIISVPFRYGYQYPWYILTRPKLLQRFWPWTEQIFFNKKMLIEALHKYCPEQKNFKVKTGWLMGIIMLFVEKQ
ncbi:MAG: class I SAM-dependent methyltransferase [Candidatus Nanoarchaeia archaeon]